MIQTNEKELTQYYATIQTNGKLIAPIHAQRWSSALLKTLGLNINKGTKKSLAKALPEPLCNDLSRVFWLANFRDTNMTAYEFQELVARRSGNSDPNFAKHPIIAIFGALKQLIDAQMSDQVASDLSPELRDLWQNA